MIIKAFIESNICFYLFSPMMSSLESLFIDLTLTHFDILDFHVQNIDYKHYQILKTIYKNILINSAGPEVKQLSLIKLLDNKYQTR